MFAACSKMDPTSVWLATTTIVSANRHRKRRKVDEDIVPVLISVIVRHSKSVSTSFTLVALVSLVL